MNWKRPKRLQNSEIDDVAGTRAMASMEIGRIVYNNFCADIVEGRRAVDASIALLVPQSNTQDMMYAIAEKATAMIEADLQSRDHG